MMRAFIAAELGRDARESIRALVCELNRELEEIRFIPVEKMHLTLKFLGDVEESFVHELIPRVATSVSCLPGPFQVWIEGVGTFGGRQPRIIWAGIVDRSGLLARMHLAVESALATLGVPAEKRTFSPHITLARLKKPVANLSAVLGPRRGISLGATPIESCALFQSILGPEGARHDKLHVFPIKKASAC